MLVMTVPVASAATDVTFTSVPESSCARGGTATKSPTAMSCTLAGASWPKVSSPVAGSKDSAADSDGVRASSLGVTTIGSGATVREAAVLEIAGAPASPAAVSR